MKDRGGKRRGARSLIPAFNVVVHCVKTRSAAYLYGTSLYDPANTHSFEAHVDSKERMFAFPSQWGRCPEGTDRALPGKLNENRGKSDASLRIYEGVEAAAFLAFLLTPSHLSAIPTQPKFAISEEIREAAVILWYNYRYR